MRDINDKIQGKGRGYVKDPVVVYGVHLSVGGKLQRLKELTKSNECNSSFDILLLVYWIRRQAQHITPLSFQIYAFDT